MPVGRRSPATFPRPVRPTNTTQRVEGHRRNNVMKYALLAGVLAVASIAVALDGQNGIHDPSTVVQCNGKFYTYGTGGSSLVSDDGWTWRRGTTLPRRGLAPDVIHIGDRYYVYVAANIGAQPK